MANEGFSPSMPSADTTMISDQASATRLRRASGALISCCQTMKSV